MKTQSPRWEGLSRKISFLILFLHENTCCGYSFEAPCWGVFMSTQNRKNKKNTTWISPLVNIFFLTTKYVHPDNIFLISTPPHSTPHPMSNASDENHIYILKISPPKSEGFQIKILIFFHISAQNIDCGNLLELPQWGSSKEYPQSMFLSKNKKNNLYLCKPQFYYIKEGFTGVKII